MPFALDLTTTPVNRQSHARQGVPRIRAVARQAIANITNFHAKILYHLVAAEGVKMCQTLCHLATLLPDPVVATSDVAKSVTSI